jgi:hypothetical protein
VLHIPYLYHLFLQHKIHPEDLVEIYPGMDPFYFFLSPTQIMYHTTPRHYVPPNHRITPNQHDDVDELADYSQWTPPPYQHMYRNSLLIFDRPLLVIHNKYNVEWNQSPINFLDPLTLDLLFSTLSPHYQVVYLCADTKARSDYSQDHNTVLSFPDRPILDRHPQILSFSQLLGAFPEYNYNMLKLMLFANCRHYITVQGGGAALIAYFAQKMLVLHKKGWEWEKGSYQGWYQRLLPSFPTSLVVVREAKDLVDAVPSLFLSDY